MRRTRITKPARPPSPAPPALAAAAQDEAPVGQRAEVVLERREVAGEEVVERAPGRAAGPDPAAQRARSDLLGGLLGQREEDRQLRLVLELAGDDAQRIEAEHPAELLLGQSEAVHEQRRGGRGHRRCLTPTADAPPTRGRAPTGRRSEQLVLD